MAAGRKTGGRQKGSPNKATIKNLETIKATGLTPLEYLTSVFQDLEADEAKRIDAAKAAAPYVHPRLNATTVSGDPDNPLMPSTIKLAGPNDD